MRYCFLVLMAVLLTGCVTIHQTPPIPVTSLPAPAPASQAVEICRPYEPPTRRKVPTVPDIGEPKGNYELYLEGAAEMLVDHITALRHYIANEHQAEDDALKRHQRDCKQ